MANIYEVAKRARVSIATVSRVQRGGQGVAPETRERVLDAIDALRYRPSGPARSLAGGRHGALGIVFPDLSGPYYAGVILGFEEHAASAGESVMILATHNRAGGEEQVFDLAQRVDGLVVMGRTVSDEAVRRLDDSGIPVVLLARPQVGNVPTIRSENAECAAALTTHVAWHGIRRMVFVGDPDSSPDVAERFAGFTRAHRDAGLGDPPEPIRCAMREQEGYRAALQRIGDSGTSGGRPEALLCANDEMALGALAAAQDAGVAVPRDLVVTGWDDIPVARFAAPPLTTVRQPLRRLGASAAAALQDSIQGIHPPRQSQTVLPAELVIRASCGCTPASTGGDDR